MDNNHAMMVLATLDKIENHLNRIATVLEVVAKEKTDAKAINSELTRRGVHLS